MKILYGTTNPAKIHHMNTLLTGLDIELIGLRDLDIDIPKVIESGETPLENARIKARAYAQVTGLPVFSCDTGLYIEGLSVEAQPGVHARRKHMHGTVSATQCDIADMTDDEMIEYYANIASSLGGEAYAWYENAICLIFPDGECYEKQGGDLSSERFLIVSEPHIKREVGFPINCLSVEIESRKYYNDLPQSKTQLYCEDKGFKKFFKRALAPIHLGVLNENMAKEVCKWRYQGLYSVYNLSDWEVVVSNCWALASESEREAHFVSISQNDELIGFGRIHHIDNKIMLGIGLKPDLCGVGYGAKAMGLLIAEAKKRYPNTEIGLEVRRFNQRAKKCYEFVGFKVKNRYMKETIEGYIDYEYMKLEQ